MTSTPSRTKGWAPRAAAPVVVVLAVALLGVAGRATAQDDPTIPTTESPTTTLIAASLALDRAVVQFGEVAVDRVRTEVVRATAEGGPVEDITVRVDGPFQVDNGCAGEELEPDDACSITIRFAPTESGSVVGTLDVESSVGVQMIGVEGTGTRPVPTSIPPATDPPTTDPPAAETPSSDPRTIDAPDGDPPTPTTTPQETREECDARALGARIAYSPRLQMRVGEARAVAAVASTDTALDPTTSGVPTTVVSQPLRCQVRARLVGNDFTINPDGWQVASFRDTVEISWLWLVTPNVVGDGLLLILEVQGLRFDADAGTYVEAGEAFHTTARIEVDSRSDGVVRRVNGAVTGFVMHPVIAFVGTGGLAACAGWGYRKFRGVGSKRGRSKPPSDPPECQAR